MLRGMKTLWYYCYRFMKSHFELLLIMDWIQLQYAGQALLVKRFNNIHLMFQAN